MPTSGSRAAAPASAPARTSPARTSAYSQRLDGWKVIGAHFDRDRSTAIRWANERHMPVHRIPGGKSATVFAFADELDRWALSQDDGAAPDDLPAGSRVVSANPPTTALYLNARAMWAERSEGGLRQVIAAYEAVIAADPYFAPAWAELAQTYVIGAEHGVGCEAENYPKVRAFAERALSLDPDLASAHRAVASYRFGWMRDTPAAGRAYRRAIALAPHDILTRIWFGDALATNSEFAAAQAQYDIAQLSDVGPLPLQLNRAWLTWLAGDGDRAIARLRELSRRYPGNLPALEFITQALLGEGDISGYLEVAHKRDGLLGKAETGLAQRLDRALRAGGIDGFLDVAIASVAEEETQRPAPNSACLAYFASAVKDRSRLIAILDRAEAAGEVWSSAWIADHIVRRWAGDTAIVALAVNRPAPRMLPRERTA